MSNPAPIKVQLERRITRMTKPQMMALLLRLTETPQRYVEQIMIDFCNEQNPDRPIQPESKLVGITMDIPPKIDESPGPMDRYWDTDKKVWGKPQPTKAHWWEMFRWAFPEKK